MNQKQKTRVYMTVCQNTTELNFAPRNLLLTDLAADLGLKHWFDDKSFELHNKRGTLLASYGY